jgi:hypothetical protein
MTKVRVGKGLIIQLPAELADSIHEDDEFLVDIKGRSLRLVPVDVPTILRRTAATPDPEQPSPEELNRIIHDIRRQTR